MISMISLTKTTYKAESKIPQIHLVFSAINLEERNVALSIDLVSRRVAVQTFGLREARENCEGMYVTSNCLPTQHNNKLKFLCNTAFHGTPALSLSLSLSITCMQTHTPLFSSFLFSIIVSVCFPSEEKALYLPGAFPSTCYF